MTNISVVRGDITKTQADAIVNAANAELLPGGGVCGAIHSAGGPAIEEECRRTSAILPSGRLNTGEAVATTAGNLPARWVIHAVGPVYGHSGDDAALLRAAYLSSLRCAEELGASSIAFPAISTGIYGYPVDEAAVIAVDAVASSSTSVKDVLLVCFDERTYEAFVSALDKREGEG